MRPRPLTVTVVFSLPFLLIPLALMAPAEAPQSAPVQNDEAAEEISQPNWPAEPVGAAKAMVVSDEQLASDVGVEILKKGGNAVDAAVAVAFALAVVKPRAGNLGGGGFMLVRMADGRAGFVDYREQGPGGATPAMYVRPDGAPDPEASTIGYRAVAVPGTPAGLELALRTYGTMKLARVIAPATHLAQQGFPVSEKLARSLRSAKPLLERFARSRKIFLKDGALFEPGEIFRQPELAVTLRRMARHGTAEFYCGETARALASEMSSMGGLVSLNDLARYRAKIREPLRATYPVNSSQWEVITSPPPSSGGIATIEALNLLAPVELEAWDDAQSVHWVVETMRRIFADRTAYLADADFTHVPVRGLTDPRYAAELRASIDPVRASSSKLIGAGNPAPFDREAGPPPGSPSPAAVERLEREAEHSENTTHFSVVDAAGNAATNTFTLNDNYGSGVTAPGGFLLNDTMDDFTTAPGRPNKLFALFQSDANAPGPGKRPLSSMTPTILLRDGRLSFVTGSPGGPRIISATLLSIVNWMRLGMDAQQAINAPRFHHQWMPDLLYVERIFPEATARELEGRGYKVVPRSWIGQVEAIAIDPRTGEKLGAPDARREGAAAGF